VTFNVKVANQPISKCVSFYIGRATEMNGIMNLQIPVNNAEPFLELGSYFRPQFGYNRNLTMKWRPPVMFYSYY